MKLHKRFKHVEEHKPRQIQTRSGIVEGKQLWCNKGPIDVFLGIPYAKPPTGDRRFKKPEAISPWTGVMKCKRYRSRAPQKDFFWDRIDLRVGKNEDCLYLNIITPGWKPRSEKNGFPVMFYIHGGGFMIDSAVKYHYSKIARLLVSKDVIAVTVQYRLGFLGFFTTGDEICLGNFGIWDQIMALKWVKENIEYFGGNPDRITVIGQSAGAVSADLLALSPHSRDLFKQIILLGGNADCFWAVSDAKSVSNYCRRQARKLGWQGTDNVEMIKFLRKLPASKLGDRFVGNKELFTTGRLPLAPVIDGDLLPYPIAELRKQSPTKPSIVGLTEDEGLIFEKEEIIKIIRTSAAIGRLACDMKDIEMRIQLMVDDMEESKTDAKQMIGQIYLNRGDNDVNNRRRIQRASIDYSLIVAATHGVELVYLFDANIFLSPFLKTTIDKQVTQFLTQSIVNFIKYRNPNISDEMNHAFPSIWKPVTLDFPGQHLRIADVIEMRSEFKNGRMKQLKDFFDNLTQK